MGRLAKGDLAVLKPDQFYTGARCLLDLDTLHEIPFPVGHMFLVLAVRSSRRGWQDRWGNRLYYRVKVLDSSSGKLYAASLKSLTKVAKE